MFLIMDMMPGVKILKEFVDTCPSCGERGQMRLIKTYQCLRLFFIPLFKWGTQYYVEHECGAMMALLEEDAIGILHAGARIHQVQTALVQKHPRRCNECGRVLEDDFICCPYCGASKV